MVGNVYLVGGSTNSLVHWLSSDPAMAEINASGVVTGKKAGTAFLTATAKQNGSKFKTVKVTIQSQSLAQAPVITNMAPTFGVVGTTSSVEIHGQNLLGSTVSISGGGVQVQNTQVFDSGTRIKFEAVISANAGTGTRAVTITNQN